MSGLPATTSKTKFFAFNGGLDQETPQIALPEGVCYDALNFDCGVLGGYRRIDGYERFDGRTKPSLVVPTYVGTTQRERAIEKAVAADAQRALIQAVPGSGPVRGVVVFKGVAYAFRDNAGGTACVMHKATVSGWVVVTTPALLPGGKYHFISYNFGGATDTEYLYGCSGADKAFYFDGTTFTKITTGMTLDAPSYITAHRNHLFLAFGASVQHSAIGDPTNWTPVLGASELAMGDIVTGFSQIPGSEGADALFVATEDSLKILYGTSSTDWKLVTVSEKIGALAGSIQELGQVFFMAKNGITNLQQSSAFGNFAMATFSQKVERFLSTRYTKVIGSALSMSRNNYRVFFSDGYAISITFTSQGVSGFMPHYYGKTFNTVWSGKSALGDEIIFASGDDGFVYELDVGTSFDGSAISSKLNLGYAHFGSPRALKRYRKAIIETTGEGYCELYGRASLGYETRDIYQAVSSGLASGTSSAFFDVDNWDSFYFDARPIDPIQIELSGTAENMSLQFATNDNYSAAFTLYAATVHYSPRRQLR